MNYMPEVAKMLGVELGEEFEINYSHGRWSTAKFTNTGLHIINTNIIDFDGDLMRVTLDWLLGGLCTIKRKPWKPQDDELYFHVDEDGIVWYITWEDECLHEHMNYYKLGNCYKTKEEAEKNKQKWIDFYASDEVLEV